MAFVDDSISAACATCGVIVYDLPALAGLPCDYCADEPIAGDALGWTRVTRETGESGPKSSDSGPK